MLTVELSQNNTSLKVTSDKRIVPPQQGIIERAVITVASEYSTGENETRVYNSTRVVQPEIPGQILPVSVTESPVRNWVLESDDGRETVYSCSDPQVPGKHIVTATAAEETATAEYTVAEPVFKFQHPGVQQSDTQFNFTRSKLSVAPWSTFYTNMVNRKAGSGANQGIAFSSTSWTPKPIAKIGRGAYGNPSLGDKDFIADGKAALVHALIGKLKNSQPNRDKAVSILNSYTSTLQTILFDTVTYRDGKLLAGWSGTIFARAAELVRDEPKFDKDSMARLFNSAWWPLVSQGHIGGGHNTLAVMAQAMIDIAVFLDDEVKFRAGCQYWRDQLPGVFYSETDRNPYAWGKIKTLKYADGSILNCPNGLPMPPKGSMYDKEGINAVNFMTDYWHQPLSLPDGLPGELGRDFHHMAMGLAGFIGGAETARLHGVDLYSEAKDRLVPALEISADLIYKTAVGGANPCQGWPYKNNATFYMTSTQRVTYEQGLNEFENRLGIPMPKTKLLVEKYVRGTTMSEDLHVNFEGLLSNQTP